MKHFPSEIYFNVFSYLPKPSIEQCLYVNKLWHQHAAQSFFDTIVLVNNHKEFLNALVSSENGQCIGRWVKKLVIKQGKSLIPLDKSEFRQLIAYLPHLKKIEFNNRSYALACLQNLLELDNKYMPYLKEIDLVVPNLEGDKVLYYWYTEVMYKLAHNMTHLTLENFSIDRFGNSEEKMIEYVSCFSNLKQLIVSNTRISGIHNLNILNILQACPDLQSFELRSYLKNKSSETLIYDSKKRFAPHHKKLKNLHLSICHLDLPLMQYMMQHIQADYMDSCTLRVYGSAFNDWVNDKSFCPNIYKFADYLQYFQNLNICMASTLGGRSVNHTHPQELLKNSTNALWAFVNRIKGNRKMFGDVLLDLDNVRYNHLKPLINVKDNRSLKLWLSLSYLDQDVQRSHHNDTLLYDWDSYFSLPSEDSQKQLSKGFPLINFLHVNHRLFDVSDSQGIIQLLACLLKKCHWLKYLYFEGKESSMLFGPVPMKSYMTHFEYKEAHRCDNQPVETTTKENLKYASIQHMFISETFIQSVLSQLPQLHTLQLSRCSFEKQDETNCYLLQLSEITHLPRLELLLNVPVEYHINFKIDMANNATVFYECKGGKLFENSITITTVPEFDSNDNNTTTYIIQCPRIDTVSIQVPSLTETVLTSVDITPHLDSHTCF